MSLLSQASLIVTPNAYKEGKLYSVIPSDGSGDLSVTRATTATRVNSAGLVELVPYNLLQYSEQFNNAAWTKLRLNVTANAITAPDGTLTADRIIANTDNSDHSVFQSAITSSSPAALSIYAKAGEYNYIFLGYDNGLANQGAFFNLSNGTISQNTSGFTASIQSVGNGWYRCMLSSGSSNWGTTYAIISLSENGTSFIFAGDNSKGVFIWGAQAVEGSSAKDYQKTETRLNIPRLDYSNGTCPSILVEPQRTNLALYSSSFDNAAWINENCSETANALIAPDGTMSADYIVEDSTPSTQHRARQVISGSTNAIHTFSVYVKQGVGSRSAYIDAGPIYAYYNFSTGVVTAVNCVGSVENVGNDWYRFIITSNSAWTPTGIYVGLANGTSETYSGNGTSSIAFWGAQLEAGSYATSYIPTTSASVTRNADVISKTGISSLIGQTEGTMFVDFNISEIEPNPDYAQVANLSNNNLDNRLGFARLPNGGIHIYVVAGGVGQFTYNTTQTIGEFKLAITYKLNDYAIYLNGTNIYTNNSASVPNSLSRFDLGNLLGSYQTKVRTNAAVLWKTRLTNDELASLTTL